MTPTPTFRDIGAVAGVSAMTVSRALRNHPAVRPETREKVHAAARQLGYRPDPLHDAFMRRLRRGRVAEGTTVLAYLTTYRADSRMAGFQYIRSMEAGARARAAELGYRMDSFSLGDPGLTAARLRQVLFARGIRGVVVAPLARRGRLALDVSDLAVAAIGSSLYHPRIHKARADHAYNMQVALRELRRLGFRRPGLLMSHDALARTEYLATALMREFQAALPVARRVPSHTPETVAKPDTLQWVRRFRPDAVITVHYDLAYWLTRFPDPPVLVNLGRVEGDGCQFGIEQFHADIAAAAVDLVSEQLVNNTFGLPLRQKVVNIPGEWVDATAPAHENSAGRSVQHTASS